MRQDYTEVALRLNERENNEEPKRKPMRVAVIGCSCSGKSTFARSLSQKIQAPHIELDELNWLPGWSERPLPELRKRVQQAVSAEHWVLDGYYFSRIGDIAWPRVTTLIWLNYSFPIVFSRALRRTLRRVMTGTPVCGGNRETFRQAFLERDSVLYWVVSTFQSRRRHLREVFTRRELPNVQYLECRRPEDADRLLQTIGEGKVV